ncbi:MAG: family 16 glycoside hydrolase [Candidatus Hydrogenedentota bacterium]
MANQKTIATIGFSVIFLVSGWSFVSSAAEAIPGQAQELIGDDFSAWADDTGEWFIAGNAVIDPANSKKLKAIPGLGVAVNGPTGRTKHLVSKAEYGDVRAHIEFVVPRESNSGVYFQGRYEIQVLDSWGVAEPEYSDCGGIYQRWDDNREPKGYEGVPPRVNAAHPPGIWQRFDVIFRAARFDADGNKTTNARFVRVIHNGQVVHDNEEVRGPTRASLFNDEQPLGPLMLQGDHGPVAYRNVWMLPIEGKDVRMFPFFAMDTGTKDAERDTPEKQAAMLHELGYDGKDVSGIANVAPMLSALDEHGLRLFGVYEGISIDPGEFDVSQWEPAMKALEGRETVLWTPLLSKKYGVSSSEGDADAVKILQTLADAAAPYGLRIAIYPHTGFWVERVEDAVRVARKVQRPNVGATFNLCHWLMVDGENLRQRLEDAAPHLFMVTINGADPGDNWKSLIQTLDKGSFNVSRVLDVLQDIGYQGPIGLQGYGIGGDVRENLSHSMSAWQELCGL